MKDSPIFLVGAARSGTTILRLMLDQHPEICWFGEFGYAVDQIDLDGNEPEISRYHEYLEFNRIFKSHNIKRDRKLNYSELLKSFLIQKLELSGKATIGATVHQKFNFLLRYWPDARFIHIVRDPRDVATSVIEMGWAGNVLYACDGWIESEDRWSNFKNTIDTARCFELTYENLISNSEEVLRQVCNFIGYDYNQEMLNYESKSSYRSPQTLHIQKWKNKLSSRQIRIIESTVSKKRLEERGYQHSNLPDLNISLPERLYLKFHDKCYRIKFRINRFGFVLVLVEYLSRRLKLTKFNNLLRHRLNIIEESLLQ